jgi:hypothetical protein
MTTANLHLHARFRAPSCRLFSVDRVGSRKPSQPKIPGVPPYTVGAPPSAIRAFCELAKVGGQLHPHTRFRAPSCRLFSVDRVGFHKPSQPEIPGAPPYTVGAPPSAIRAFCELAKVGGQLHLHTRFRAPSCRLFSVDRVGFHKPSQPKIPGAPPSAIRAFCELAKVGGQLSPPKSHGSEAQTR